MDRIQEQDIKDRAMEMTGHTDDLEEAFDQWANERIALSLAIEENKILRKAEMKTTQLLEASEKIITIIETESALFLSTATQAKLTDFHAQYKKIAEAS